VYFQTAQLVAHLKFKTINNSENSSQNHCKGIFIRFIYFKTADDFCFKEEKKAKIRFIFQLLIIFLLIFYNDSKEIKMRGRGLS